jgi:hypothetical protein
MALPRTVVNTTDHVVRGGSVLLLTGDTMSDDGRQWLLMMLVSVLAVATVSGGAVVFFELHR